MRCKRLSSFFPACLLVLAGVSPFEALPARAQTGVAGAQTTLVGELESLASRAGTVFAGQVISIERKDGVVEITFRVDQPVVGETGATYVLREWAGLWPEGQFRYSVGDRALIFLNPVSAAGLGSPVDGAEGVVPIVVQGADAPALLDVRRLSAALLRSVGTPLASEADGAIQLSDAVAVISAARVPSAPRPAVPTRMRLPENGLAAKLQQAATAEELVRGVRADSSDAVGARRIEGFADAR